MCRSATRRPCCSRRPVTRTSTLLLVTAHLALAACSSNASRPPEAAGVTVFEGARLISGDGSAAVEDSAFVVEAGRFTRVGCRGEVEVPSGAMRVDLSGKTVMPAMVDLHGHLGFQNVAQ